MPTELEERMERKIKDAERLNDALGEALDRYSKLETVADTPFLDELEEQLGRLLRDLTTLIDKLSIAKSLAEELGEEI